MDINESPDPQSGGPYFHYAGATACPGGWYVLFLTTVLAVIISLIVIITFIVVVYYCRSRWK